MLNFFAVAEIRSQKEQKNRIRVAVKLTENRSRVKLLIAICPKINKLSRSVLFPIENAENYCASVFTGACRTWTE